MAEMQAPPPEPRSGESAAAEQPRGAAGYAGRESR
jgi:hypothetical protein